MKYISEIIENFKKCLKNIEDYENIENFELLNLFQTSKNSKNCYFKPFPMGFFTHKNSREISSNLHNFSG